jgi:tetratricopeptide (TPR) repeat protein
MSELLQQAQLQHSQGNLEQAQKLCKQILQNEINTDALKLLAICFRQQGRFNDALSFFDIALKASKDSGIILEKAKTLIALAETTGDQDLLKAREILGVLQERSTDDLLVLNELAKVSSLLEDYASAEKYYQQMIYKFPDRPALHNNYASLLKEQSKYPEAIEQYKTAIDLKPNLSIAYYNWLQIDKQIDKSQTLKHLEAIDIENLSNIEQMYLYFARAFIYDKFKDPENAFINYRKANDIKRKQYVFNANYIHKSFSNLANLLFEKYKITFNSIEKGTSNDFVPIFIVGMPRSGSTLIEQILATRDDVCGLGEINDLNQSIGTLFREVNFDVDNNLNIFADMTLDQIENLAMTYKQSVLAKAKRKNIDISKKKFFVDKMLANFRFIPIVKLMFPNAIIIHAKRNPMDTCWSCYKHYFSGEVPYVYNLTELAVYYNAYMSMMDFYEEKMPDSIYRFDYESFISEPENNLVKFLDFCGFEMNDSYLNFYKTNNGAKTASCLQVKEPLNSKSIDSWQKYAQYLENLEKNIDSKYK